MPKIEKIELVNYRSYYDKYSIDVNSKNLLIYGENGSGKSSLYEGLKNFFLAADSSQSPKLSRHLKVDELDATTQVQNEVAIKLTFDDKVQKIFGVPNGDVVGDALILDYSKQSVFLSYRELLRTHLMDDIYNERLFQERFAHLVISQILASSINSGTKKTYREHLKELWKSGPGSKPNRAQKIQILINFDVGFQKDINDINVYVNQILKYFEPKLEVALTAKKSVLVYAGQNYPVFKVELECIFNGQKLSVNKETHLSILNEARLSALAISIFLAGIIVTEAPSINQKFIFLDDIFVGLDMSNRKPLLRILNEYKAPKKEQYVDEITGEIEYRFEPTTTPFFDKYQVFITTYDKYWFELAKGFLSDRWQSIEMYAHYDDDLGFEVPLIHTASLTYYKKAEFYFKKNKKNKDYPAAANYLRKECEQQLKNILYGKYLLKNGESGSTVLRTQIEELKQSFDELITDLELDNTPFLEFSSIVKSTLNPLSHDNLQKPIFKRELEEAFALIDSLIEIKKDLLLRKSTRLERGTLLVLRTTNSDGVVRETFVEVVSDVYRYKQGSSTKITPIYVKPLHYTEGGVRTNLASIPECIIEKAYDMIYHSVFRTTNASSVVGVNILAEFILESGETIQQKKDA